MNDTEVTAQLTSNTVIEGPLSLYRHNPLRLRRWIIAFVLLQSIVAGSIFINSFHSALTSVENTATWQGATLSSAIVEHAASTFSEKIAALDRISALAATPADDGTERSMVNMLISIAPGVLEVLILDEKGTIRANASSNSVSDNPAALEGLFTTIRESGANGIKISKPFFVAAAKSWRVYLGRRTGGAPGAFSGAVVLTLDLDRFRSFYSELDVGANGTIGLWRDDAVLLTRQPFDANQIGLQVTNELLASFRTGRQSDSIVIASRIDGTQRRINWRRVPNVPVIVTVGYSTLDYRASLYAALRQQSFAAIAGAVLIPLLALVLWRELGRQAAALDQYRELSNQLAEERRTLQTMNTELAASNLQVVNANAAKSEFLANVSHEFRTPLNAIIGFSDIMRSEMLGPLPARYREYSSDIYASAEHLLEIVSDIIDLQQIEKSNLEIALVEIDIGELAVSCIRMLSVLSDTKRIEIIVDQPPGPAILRGDRQRVMQILVNLISNSIKYSDEGTTVTVRVIPVDGEIALQIIDNGIGMSADEIALALQPFRQIAMVRRRTNDSVGLGLPIVHGLVKALKGDLSIESRKGQGTTITVRLPSNGIA